MSLYSFRNTIGLLTLLMTSSIATAAEPIGRLFFSPEQRSGLDQQTEASKEEPRGNMIRFDGMVLRSNGRNTYWIGGNPRSSAEGIPAGLRVGEAVDPSSGDKRALLEKGALRIHHHKGNDQTPAK